MSAQLIAVVTREAEEGSTALAFETVADHTRLKRAATVLGPALLVALLPLVIWPAVSSALVARQLLADAVLGTARHHREERHSRDKAMELLRIFDLDRFAHAEATSLPYGSQRRLEIARALATEPKLLLLDEPAAGMNPQESLDLMHLVRWLRDELHLTILLVEHNMKVVMGICETIQAIDYGQTIAVGPPAEIQRHPQVIAAYLGGA